MHGLLAKLLKHRGIESAEELTPEERKDFDNWNEVLSKKELTTTDIKEFCQIQINIIQQKWNDYNIPQDRKNELLPYFTVYNAFLAAIDSPKDARATVEKQLIQLIK